MFVRRRGVEGVWRFLRVVARMGWAGILMFERLGLGWSISGFEKVNFCDIFMAIERLLT